MQKAWNGLILSYLVWEFSIPCSIEMRRDCCPCALLHLWIGDDAAANLNTVPDNTHTLKASTESSKTLQCTEIFIENEEVLFVLDEKHVCHETNLAVLF